MRRWWVAAFLCFVPFLSMADEITEHFKLLDKDSDKKMSRDESKVWNWPESKFLWADLDNDEYVTLEEFKSWIYSKKVRDRMLRLSNEEFEQMDADKNGKISFRECWCTEDLFRKMDINKDGQMTAAEAFRKVKPKLRVVKQKQKMSKPPAKK